MHGEVIPIGSQDVEILYEIPSSRRGAPPPTPRATKIRHGRRPVLAHSHAGSWSERVQIVLPALPLPLSPPPAVGSVSRVRGGRSTPAVATFVVGVAAGLLAGLFTPDLLGVLRSSQATAELACADTPSGIAAGTAID